MRKYNKTLPESLSKDGDCSKEGLRPIRPAGLGKFVLDALLDHGKKIWEDHDLKYEKLRSLTLGRSNDPDLLRPYEEAESSFTSLPCSDELKILKEHVKKCRSEWARLGEYSRTPASTNAKARADAKQKKGSTIANIRNAFVAGPPPESITNLLCLYPGGARMVRETKASYAYSLGEKFALEVAFRDICSLKASSNGDAYPVHGKFKDITAVSPSVARRYNAHKAKCGVEQR